MPLIKNNIRQLLIDKYDKGMVNDQRLVEYDLRGNPIYRYAQLIKNFDAHTYPKKLVPYRSSVSGDTAPATSQKQNFCIALRTGITYSLYALGVISGDTKAEILYKNLTQSSVNDLSDNGWLATANNQATTAGTTAWFDLFVFYRQTGLIYSARGTSATAGTHICTYDPSGVAAFNDTHRAITFTNIGQGLVHSKDDILYIPYYNNGGAAGAKSFIASNNNGVWNNTALTLPDALIPVSICEYNNYLAIGCQPASGIGNSKVFLWDRNSALTTLSEAIDWGEGNLQILEELEGYLIGISRQGVGASGQTNRFNGQITIRQYSGSSAAVIKTFISGSGNAIANNVVLPIIKQKVDHFLYFLMDLAIAGATANYNHQGLWKIGRVSPEAPFSLIFDRNLNNDASGTYVPKAFFVTGDYVFLSYTTGGAFALDKTNNNVVYSTTAYYDSQIFNLGDSSIVKKLLGVTIFNEALGGSQTITVAYKIDQNITSGTASFTTILSYTTANALSHSAINIESSGAELPVYKEIQFRITTTGGSSAIVGFKFKSEILDSDIY